MAEQLRPEGIAVYVEDVVVTTPGLTGQVEVYRAGGSGMRGEEQTTADFQGALAEAGLVEQLSVVVSSHAELSDGGGTRAGGGTDDIVVEVPAPGDGNGQVLLYAAEDGSLSWHLPEDVPPDDVPARGGERRTYRVPRAVVPGEERDATGQRGLLGALGNKVLKVLVFPLVDPVLGKVGDFFASRWESKNRPTRVRWMSVEGYARSDAEPFGDADWARLEGGRSLLLVHGTFSTAHGGFGGLDRATMSELHQRYAGRVFALDHPSVSVTPRENVAALARLIPAGVRVELDVVTHSRGGLVGRELALAGTPPVVRLVMVAAPNAGTVLADKDRLSDLLDRVTDLAQFVPDNGVTDALGMVFAVLKQVAVGAFGGLEGIMAMNPQGDYLAELNAHPAPQVGVWAVAADYQPPSGTPLLRVARDGATDLMFSREPNDLVVPTRGCWDVDGAPGFPIAERLVLAGAKAVNHNSFFSDDEVNDQLLDWLSAP